PFLSASPLDHDRVLDALQLSGERLSGSETDRATRLEVIRDLERIADERLERVAELTQAIDRERESRDEIERAAHQRLELIEELTQAIDHERELKNDFERAAAERLQLIQELHSAGEHQQRI